MYEQAAVDVRIDNDQYRRVSKSLDACCTPGTTLTSAPLATAAAVDAATTLKALADPVRLRMLSLVMASSTGEACACDLQNDFDLSQPTISHHLKVLHSAGLLEREKRGTWVWYRVRTDTLARVSELFAAAPGQS